MRSAEEQLALRLARRTENDELRLQARWPARVALRAPETDKTFFALPYLFAGAFAAVPDARLRRLALACKLLRNAELLRAAARGGDDPRLAGAALRAAADQVEAHATFAELVGGDTAFWDAMLGAEQRLAWALSEEEIYRSGRRAIAELDDADAVALAGAKIVSLPVALAGVAALAGGAGPREALALSAERYAAARQLLADLRGWKADLGFGRATWVLARLARAAPEAFAARDVAALTRTLFLAGVAREALARVGTSCAQALETASAVPGNARWSAVVALLARRAAALLAELQAGAA